MTISGKIVDKQQQGIEDAFVYNVSNNKFTSTNEMGHFTLDLFSESDTLEVIRMGFESRYIYLAKIEQPVEIQMESSQIELAEVVVRPSLKPMQVTSALDLATNPVKSSQEILQKVPGLFIGQHAGGGKAEQIFLRGFDIDHGTDINITVDGMPVNMVSHAHGQGYADLHFVIPETVEKITYGKGPYYADKGNFNTAGFVEFKTRQRLEESSLQMEMGQFNSKRMLAMLNVFNKEKQSAYVAGEWLQTDGFFESPQNFNRFNLLAKYQLQLDNEDQLSLTASHFRSRWTASGQIPVRAIEAGLISRFGAIDDTEGGFTSRTNVAVNHNKYLSPNSFIKNNFYFSRYDFELYSNFTFFLNDPINGDQIRQKEQRNIYGFSSEWNRSFHLAKAENTIKAGIGLRADQIYNNELTHTLNRVVDIENIQLGDVTESNLFSYFSNQMDWANWSLYTGIRLDYFDFGYKNTLIEGSEMMSTAQSFISPKISLNYRLNPNWQLYIKGGRGFHSNDSRVVTTMTGKETLPAAWGADLGWTWKAAPRLFLNGAAWYLYLEQEFVYVGDEGIVEASGQSRRLGLDLGMRYQLGKYWFLNADVNYAFARSLDAELGADYIPLAPDLTATGGLSVDHPSGWSGSIRYRFLKNRPANEDNSIIAKGYFLTDFNVNYDWKAFRVGVNIENLFNTQWKETQFATLSRMAAEPAGVEEIHFTPGTPFFVKAVVRYTF